MKNKSMSNHHHGGSSSSGSGNELSTPDVSMLESDLGKFIQEGLDRFPGPSMEEMLAGSQSQDGHTLQYSHSGHLFGSAGGSGGLFSSNMTPLQHETSTFLSLYSPYIDTSLFQEESEHNLLTPIISPALTMTPSTDFANLNLHSGSFSPLSSPALRPSTSESSGTNPGIKRTPASRRNTLPTAAGGAVPLDHRKKKAIPRSPYTIPRPNPSGIDPFKISSPMLRPEVVSRQRESISPEITPPATAAPPLPDMNGVRKGRDLLFKVPMVPASRLDLAEKPGTLGNSLREEGGVEANGSTSSSNVNAVTPGMLLYLKSDDEKETAESTSPMEEVSPASEFVVVEKKGSGSRRKSGAVSDKVRFASPSLKPLLPVLSASDGGAGLIGFDVSEMAFESENKKEHHKVSEQKRRDSMKQNFDNLKAVLPHFSDKNPSKERVLQFSREYIVRLRHRVGELENACSEQSEQEKRDAETIRALRAEIEELKKRS
ncbi:hypothetical protein HDU98_010416 [Podochytrium sp. JEL0797]|nr:hypothetical protein HDU98_010416 [Podochytrium sp. JEL0797]